MKLRDDARGLHAQGEAHELPHGKRLLGMRRLTPVGIPFLQASHISTDRVFGRRDGRFGTFWHQLKACTDKSPLPTALLPEPRESIGLRSRCEHIRCGQNTHRRARERDIMVKRLRSEMWHVLKREIFENQQEITTLTGCAHNINQDTR